MSLPVQHIVGASIDGVQSCVLCGTVIADYRNAMTCTPGPIPTWPEGDIYVHGRNPTVYSTMEPEGGFESCSNAR